MFVRPKGNRKRAVPIPIELIEPLREHLTNQDAQRHAAGDAWEDRDVVWCGPEGQPIDPHDDWEEWKALLAEAGITKDARLHDARHTAGTLLGEQHVDLHVILRILGHAQVTTTPDLHRAHRSANPRGGEPNWEGAVAGCGETATKTATRSWHLKLPEAKNPSSDGCAARDLNPEPAD